MTRHDTDRSAAAAERDVADAREDLRDTLGELEARLDPNTLFDQGIAYFRGDGRRYVSALKREAQLNPIAVGLLGVGIAWLAVNAMRRADDRPVVANRTGREPMFEHDDHPATPLTRTPPAPTEDAGVPGRPIRTDGVPAPASAQGSGVTDGTMSDPVRRP